MALLERGRKGITSIKRRLDHLIDQLSTMGAEPDPKAAGNAAAQLAIICGAFHESAKSPVCCFIYDSEKRIFCDSFGPLGQEEFMQKCTKCQSQIKQTLSLLQ